MSIDLLDKAKRTGVPETLDAVVEQVRETVAGLRFGSVELVIHDGRVVQIERRERLRLERPSGAEC